MASFSTRDFRDSEKLVCFLKSPKPVRGIGFKTWWSIPVLGVPATVLIRVAKFLTKATEGRKGSLGSQFQGTQSIAVEPSPCRSIKQLVPLYPVRKQRENTGAQLLFSFYSTQDSNPWDGTVYF